MAIVSMILIGLIAGGFAKLLMPWSGLGGLLLLGVGGSFLSGGLWYAENQPASVIPSIAGSLLLLVIYRFTAQRTPESRVSGDHRRKAA
jgi:uncharacterized membrane protein YeaQ/YmgE (transglycosylase-associated protein family)